ncbi:GWxTD domain-containing protein, partial [candidate division KSB1 bacterium]
MLNTIIISFFLLFSPQTDKKEQAKALANKGYQLIEEKEYKEAVKTFDKAIKLDKNFKEAHLGKGIAYYKGGNYNRLRIYPEEFIKRALKIDPFYIDAKIHLGWAYFYKGNIEESVDHFRNLLNQIKNNADVDYQAAKFFNGLENFYYHDKIKVFDLLKKSKDLGCEVSDLYYMLGWKYFLKDSMEHALQMYDKGLGLEKNDRNFIPYLESGIIYVNMGDSLKAEEQFYLALERMSKPYKKVFEIPKNEVYTLKNKVLRSLAVKYYMDRHSKLTRAGKDFLKEGLVLYEKASITDNALMSILSAEQLNKYKKLVTIKEKNKFMKKHFLQNDLTPFNDDNEMEEEFHKRFKYVMDNYRNRTWDRGFDDRGKIYLKYGEPSNKHASLNSESWYYGNINFYLGFDFGDWMAKRYYMHPSLIGAPNTIPVRMNYSAEFMSPVINMISTKADVLGGPWRMLSGSDPTFIFADAIEFELYRKEIMDKYIPSYYPANVRYKHFNFSHKVADFEYSGNMSTFEFYFGTRLKNLKFVENGNKFSSSLKLQTKLLDSGLHKILADSSYFTFSSDSMNIAGITINQLRYHVPPGDYTLFLQITNPEGEKTGLYSRDVHVDNYSQNELSLSDIQFSFDIRNSKPDDKYIKNGLNIIPYPFFEVSKSKPLFIYYEIYNLVKNNKGRTRYNIEYEIRYIKEKESTLGALFKKLFKGKGYEESVAMSKKEDGNNSDTFDYTKFDFSNLRIGNYKLIIKIKDLVSGKQIEKSEDFILIK